MGLFIRTIGIARATNLNFGNDRLGNKLQTHLTCLNAFIKRSVERHESRSHRIVKVDRVGGRGRVEAFALEIMFNGLESGGHVDRWSDPQEQRPA